MVVKWEGSSDVVLGIEPLPARSSVLRWSSDPRFTVPCDQIIGSAEVGLFTEKLNLKRAGAGRPDGDSRIVLHQDQPYWTDYARDVDRIVTAVLHIAMPLRSTTAVGGGPAVTARVRNPASTRHRGTRR